MSDNIKAAAQTPCHRLLQFGMRLHKLLAAGSQMATVRSVWQLPCTDRYCSDIHSYGTLMCLSGSTDQAVQRIGGEDWIPVAHILVEGSKGTPHVGAHVTGRLIGDLDTGLQNGFWHNFGLQIM